MSSTAASLSYGSEPSLVPDTDIATPSLAFAGSAREYFRIWAVNLCLTLLTLGIFSAWAKVRKKRYFYSHTLLDGTPFQYLGQPVPILKGRIIAALLFLLYYLASHIFTSLLPYVLALGAVLAPWVLARSAAFNARYSAYRNMTFRFEGNYLTAALAIYWMGLIPLIVIGSLFQWWGNYALGLAAVGVFGLVFPWWLIKLRQFVIDNTVFGGNNGALTAKGQDLLAIYFKAGLLMVLFGIVSSVIMFSVLRTSALSPTTIYGITALLYAGYVVAFAFVQAHSTNLIWNHLRVGPVQFSSTLKARGMAKLYLTNAVGIIASFGLLIPWAVIRTYKYRIEHLNVELEDGSLGDFEGSDTTAVHAAGAEIGDFFDLDLSL